MSRWVLFAGGLVASLAVTALLWWAGFPGFFLFLMLPPLLLLGRKRRRCPQCGFASASASYCPRDGTKLV